MQDTIEAQALYNLLEQDIVPLFYERSRDGLPREWIGRIKKSIQAMAPYFNTTRMLKEYCQRYYVPARERFERLAVPDLSRGLTYAQWLQHLSNAWSQVKVVEVKTQGEELKIGSEQEVHAWVDLGPLTSNDVTVQLYHGLLNSRGEFLNGDTIDMDPVGSKDGTTICEFVARVSYGSTGAHGISVRANVNLMVTSDFICPATTLHGTQGDPDLRGSVRVWDLKQRQIVRSIQIPGAQGTIDVKLIPHDRKLRAFTAGMADDHLYLVDTKAGTAKPVFDFATIAKGGWPQLMRMTANGKRLFISMNLAGKVVMFDVENPEQPRVLKVVDLGPESGPHYIALTPDQKRLVVTDYFLNEDTLGKVHAEGDHKVHVLRVSEDDLQLDARFQVDFNTAFSTGPARPHGVAFK